jgi:hypothetical protein
MVTVAIAGLAAGDAAAYIRSDWPAFFFPIYAYLGEHLRGFDIPGWNPFQFSGAPFASDPESGWGYLPAMLIFVLLPIGPAISVFVGFHIVLSAGAAYVLARLTGLAPSGAFVAGIAYAFPWLVPAASGRVLSVQVTTWLPVALIGVELARLQASPARRFAGLALSGLAISQILASWLGQGSYYALLIIGGWVAWRMLANSPSGWTIRERLTGLVWIGGGVLLIGFSLNAAALLIRLEANAQTTVADGVHMGISGWAASRNGIPLAEMATTLIGGFRGGTWQYVGASVVALAFLAPFVTRRWSPLLFWFLVAASAITLTLPDRSPLHTAMYALLPRFESIHSHVPNRVLITVPLAVAMLAGATADVLSGSFSGWRWWRVTALLYIPALAGGAIALEHQSILSWASMMAALAALAIAAIAIALPVAKRAALIPLVLATVILWDPVGRMLATGANPTYGSERSLRSAVSGDVETFLYQNGAAAFLTDATRVAPARYAGFDPALLPDVIAQGDLPSLGYTDSWWGHSNWLLVHNWGTWFRLEDIQGYNPVQSQRYAEFIDALNGHPQEYHERDLFPSGLTSPLLDLLNLRYLIVPGDAAERPDLAPSLTEFPSVYGDEHVRILENPEALPRAWLVHEAQQVAPGEALDLLADGTVDPRKVALLESAPPSTLAPASDPTTEVATYTHTEPDWLELRVKAQTPALLVLSEVWDPGWTARVDGEVAPVLVTNHVLRAISIPAGAHTVVLHFDPPLLRLGIAITVGTALLILTLWGSLIVREHRRVRDSSPGTPR